MKMKARPALKGTALAKAAKRKRPTQLGTPPQAKGNTVTGASTSTSRVGY